MNAIRCISLGICAGIVSALLLEIPATCGAQSAPSEHPSPIANPEDLLNAKLRNAVQQGRLLEARHLIDEGANVDTLPYLRDIYNSEMAAPPDEAVSTLVTIKVPEHEHVLLGETVPIHIEFKNNTDITTFVNPHFNRLESSPAGLLLFDEHKRCVGDLFDFDSFAGSHSYDKTFEKIEKGTVLKIDELFTTTRDAIVAIPNRWLLSNTNDLESHQYYIQLVYWFRYITPPPPFKARNSRDDLWRLPLFRSNLVPIQIDAPQSYAFDRTLMEIEAEDSKLKFDEWWHRTVERPHYENDNSEWLQRSINLQGQLAITKKKLEDAIRERDDLAKRIKVLEAENEQLRRQSHND